MKKKNILFICTHNSCRSQIAEGLVNHLCQDQFIAKSAGTEKTKVHPLAIEVMKEIDIDISYHYSKLISEFKDTTFDIVVTVCDQAHEACPFFPAKQVIHQSFADPSKLTGSKNEQMTAFRKTRDEIKEWIQKNICHEPETEEINGETNDE